MGDAEWLCLPGALCQSHTGGFLRKQGRYKDHLPIVSWLSNYRITVAGRTGQGPGIFQRPWIYQHLALKQLYSHATELTGFASGIATRMWGLVGRILRWHPRQWLLPLYDPLPFECGQNLWMWWNITPVIMLPCMAKVRSSWMGLT